MEVTKEEMVDYSLNWLQKEYQQQRKLWSAFLYVRMNGKMSKKQENEMLSTQDVLRRKINYLKELKTALSMSSKGGKINNSITAEQAQEEFDKRFK